MSVCPDAPDEPLYIARVCYMWEEGGGGRKMFHGQWFSRGSETVLGEVGDPCELYAVDQCDDNPLGAIMDKVKVVRGWRVCVWRDRVRGVFGRKKCVSVLTCKRAVFCSGGVSSSSCELVNAWWCGGA